MLFLFPMTAFVIFDQFFMVVLLPIIRQYIIMGINFSWSPLGLGNLFRAQDNRIYPLISHRKPVRHFLFRMPTLFQHKQDEGNEHAMDPTERNLLIRLSNYLWTIQLAKNSKTREYAYLITLVFVFVLFALGMYHFYFDSLMHHLAEKNKKNFYNLFFLIVWTAYVIFRLKTISGTMYYQAYFRRYWKQALTENAVNFLSLSVHEITVKNNQIHDMKEYTIKQTINDIESNKKHDTLDKVIEFATTIIAFMIMQYIT